MKKPFRPEPTESRCINRPSVTRVLAVLDWLMSQSMAPEELEEERRIRQSDRCNPGPDLAQRMDQTVDVTVPGGFTPTRDLPAIIRPTEPIMVSVPEAAKMLGIKPWRAYALVNAGVIPSVRLGVWFIGPSRNGLVGAMRLFEPHKKGMVGNAAPESPRFESGIGPFTGQEPSKGAQGLQAPSGAI